MRPPVANFPRRPRLLVPIVAALVALFTVLGTVVSLYTDLLWFRSVGFSEIFSTVLRTKILLFLLFGTAMATIIAANVAIAYRLRPPFRPMSPEQQNLERYRTVFEPRFGLILPGVAALFGLFAGLSAAGRWRTWLLWRHGTPFGTQDAQFHRDVSYFAFTYPFQRFVLGFLFTAVVLSLLTAAATHYLFGGIRLQTPGEKVTAPARAHLSVLLGLFVLLKAAAYFLDRYGLAFSGRGVVTGPSYTDVNAVLPAKGILLSIAVICALLFLANVFSRGWLLPSVAFGLLVVSAIVIGGVYPAVIEQFRVKPNAVEREAKYIQRNIEATRAAYQLNGTKIETYDAKTTATSAEIRNDTGTLPNTRLLDPNVLTPTYKQLQQIRAYFGFAPSLDIDRYDLGKGVQDYVVGVRELDQGGLAPDQRNWINQHLIYTHGNGFVAAPADTTDGGRPAFDPVSTIPPGGDLGLTQSRVYYGELSPRYSVVNTRQPEIDGPGTGNQGQATTTYDGKGGVQLSGIVRKVLYALKFQEKNILLSSALKPESRIQYIRNPRERVKKVAPFLDLDGDPYPAVIGGRILWILDGYTTTDGYPYSERRDFGEVTADATTGAANRARRPQAQVNYIRNSVKATVDAYDGTVRLYTFDDRDPVLRTWKKAFPGIVRPNSDMSADLRNHLRYPEDQFKVQRDLLARYHVTNARAFFSKEDFWSIPQDPSQENAGDQPPYYLFLQVPGTPAPSFSLTTSFVARNRPNLAAFVSVSSDPADYGTMRVLRLPQDTPIQGPGTVAGTFESNPAVSTTLSLLRQGGSKVILGNLLTLPVGGGLLYIQPVYVQASGGESFPLLRKVIVGFGDEVAFEDSLQQALDRLFGQGTAVATPAPSPGAGPAPSPGASPPPVTGSAELQQAIAEANAAYVAGQDALRRGDFAEYGRQQDLLKRALDRITASTGGAPVAGASPTPAPGSSPMPASTPSSTPAPAASPQG